MGLQGLLHGCLRYPGVKNVEQVYFYAVPVVDDDTRRRYLDESYRLGREFDSRLTHS